MVLAVVHWQEELCRRRCAGRGCGRSEILGRGHFDRGGEPDHFKYGRNGRRSGSSQKLERSDVAAETTVIGGVVRFAFRPES